MENYFLPKCLLLYKTNIWTREKQGPTEIIHRVIDIYFRLKNYQSETDDANLTTGRDKIYQATTVAKVHFRKSAEGVFLQVHRQHQLSNPFPPVNVENITNPLKQTLSLQKCGKPSEILVYKAKPRGNKVIVAKHLPMITPALKKIK